MAVVVKIKISELIGFLGDIKKAHGDLSINCWGDGSHGEFRFMENIKTRIENGQLYFCVE